MHPRHWTCTWWGWLVGFQQALHGFLGTLFWRKTLRAAKKPQLIFWNNFHRLSVEFWVLCFGGKLKTLCATKKPQLIFWNKFSPGITGEKAGRVFTLCKASSGHTRKNWVGFHTWNLIADSKQHWPVRFFIGKMLPKSEIRNWKFYKEVILEVFSEKKK